MNPLRYLLPCIISVILWSCGNKEDEEVFATFQLKEIEINGETNASSYTNVDPNLNVTLTFSEEIDQSTLQTITFQTLSGQPVKLTYIIQDKTIILHAETKLDIYTAYQLIIHPGLKSITGKRILTGKVYSIFTGMDNSDKFPSIEDEELLTLVQKQTFSYFWDFGHPVSGMARERSSSGDIVTTGGTGFGIMAMIVGV
ncbi:MAG: hypothetical protein PWQ06_2489, partial [Anaerophaga sp.]|nr:hypothetical protein [Anaerophaga sp.]